MNGGLAVYSDTGVLLADVSPINQFFGQLPENDPNSPGVSDPRCLYDPTTKRWFVSAISYLTDALGNITSSAQLIAVSTTRDPTGAYVAYTLDTTKDGSDFLANDCPCLGDQPLIGMNADGLYLSTNVFGQKSFEGAQLYMISKSALVNLASNPVVSRFDQLSAVLPDVEFSFSVQPSFSPPLEPGEAGTEYFVQAMRALRAEQRIAVWALSNTTAIDTDPSKITLNFIVIPSEEYAQPVMAAQKAGSTPLAKLIAVDSTVPGDASEQQLDGNDVRMQQVMFSEGKLWSSLGTAVTSAGSPVRDGAAWFVIDANNSGTALQAAVTSQGICGGSERLTAYLPRSRRHSKR